MSAVQPQVTAGRWWLLLIAMFACASEGFAALDPPALISPANRDSSQPATPQLRWNAVVFADHYELQISTDSTFSGIRFDTVVVAAPTPSAVIGPLGYDSTYYWRVRTSDAGGAYGLWSAFWRFKTVRPVPAIPSLFFPANNAVSVSLSDSVVWTAVAFADAYGMQISTNALFTANVVDTVVPVAYGDPKQRIPLQGLLNKRDYWWRVNARNAAGASAWSAAWKFTTIVDTPAVPTLTAPADAAKSLVTNPTLSWGSVTDATKYQLQAATDAGFTALVLNDTAVVTTSKQLTGLANATTYYWRVRAKNIAGIGNYSPTRSFSTQLAQPALVAPTNAGTNVPIQTTLDWGPVASAVSYRVQMSTATSFAPLLLNTVIAGDAQAVGDLLNNTKYYWRVSAISESGDTSTYPATAWNFTTIVDTPTVPNLSGPADGTKSLPTNPTLTWADTGGTTFKLQVATDPSFSSLVYQDSTLSTKTKQVSGLVNGATYYWRVSAKNVAAGTGYSPVWHFSTQLPQATIVAPATGATGQPLSVTLDWAPIAEATSYLLQVSKSTGFSPALVNSTLGTDSYPLGSLANNTKYYWRVRGTNANGDTSTYPATAWNFTTIVDTPTVPVLLTPAVGATSLPLNPTLTWEDTGATTYRLQVALDAGFASLVFNDSSLSAKSKQLAGLSYGAQYYWRVNAKNVSATSAYSAVRSFTTLLGPVSTTSPASGIVDQPTTVQLTWSPVAGAASYLVQVSTAQSPFTANILNAMTANAYIPLSGLQNNFKYYWRVSARNANGDTSLFPGTPVNFKTRIPAPLLSTPANNAVNQPVNPTLSWNISSGANKYRLQVSESPTFQGGTKFDDSTLTRTTTSRQIGPLDNSRTYYWRINATDSSGLSVSDWSEVWGFTTRIDTPAVPVLAAPAQGATNQPITFSLSWLPSAGATLYTLQVAYDSLFTQKIVNGPPVITTSQSVGPLLNNTRYFWRVNAVNATGTATSAFSSPWSFTTIIALPEVPMTVSPGSGAVNQPQMVNLKWRRANSASTYHVELATNSQFIGASVVDTSGVVDTALTVGPLANNGFFYWRISSANALGSSAPSPVSSFSTVIAAPGLISPANDITNLATPVTFQWTGVVGASSYRLQIATEATFAAPVVDDSLIAGTSRPVSALSLSKKYFWRVLAVSATNGVSASAVWNFTTTVLQPDVPTLAFPAHNSVSQPVRIRLRWFAALGARSYRLQVATNPTFANGIVFDTPGLTDTTQDLTTLQYNTIYYWRVMALNDIGPSEYSLTWNFTTSVPPPAIAMLTSPLNGESGVARPTPLVWRSASGAVTYSLKVLLTNRSVVENRTGLTDTTVVLSSLAPGVQYLWRVWSVNSGGIDSSAEWAFTTAIDPPVSPVPVGPADGSINQPTALVLRWRSSPSATLYRLQVASDPGFTTLVYTDSTITDTARAVSALSGLTAYYWHVSARNTGGISTWSPTWMFTTIIASPVLRLPADGAQHQPIAPTLAWSRVNGAAQYRLQVALDPLFSALAFDQVVPLDTTQVVTGLSGFTTYFWRVYAQNAGGSSTSPYSASRNFTTLVDTPRVVAPVDGAQSQPTIVRMTWKVTPFVQTYSIQVAADPSFATMITSQAGISDTTVLVGPLPGKTRCYWRIRGHNQADSSEFSAPRSFTTTLSTPPMLSPADGVNDLPIALSLRWSQVLGGARYRVQVGRDSLLAAPVFDDSLLVGDSVRVQNLLNATRYFWRVRAKSIDGVDVSAFSTPWSFTTIIDTPTVPVLVAPATNTINIPTTLALVWRSAARASTYRLQVNTDPGFTAPMSIDTVVADTSRQIGPMSGLTKYYWRVAAGNIGGTSPYSSTANFTTAIPTPILVSPSSGTLDLPISLSLLWHPVLGGGTYKVQVATDSLFTTRVVDDSSLTDTSRIVNGLLHQKKYFWHVRAKNPSGNSISGYSTTWSFTTIIDTPSVPVLQYPAAGTMNVPTAIRLRWKKADRAAVYRVELATDSLFSNIFMADSALTDTTKDVSGLGCFIRYFWRARASNIAGATPYSAVAGFTTVLSTPVLAAPAPAALDQPILVTLQWQPVPSAVSYRVQISTDSTFKTFTLDDSLVVAVQRSSPLLLNQTRYFWRVRGKAGDGITTSTFADTRSFTTIVDTPAAPQLATPSDKQAGLSTTPILRWHPSGRAAGYAIDISTDSLFGTLVVNQTGLTDTACQVGPLATLTRYWWRVRGENVGGISPSSSAWSFYTIIATPTPRSPADSATMQPISLTISWDVVPGATTYRLQVCADTLFNTNVLDDSTITVTSRTVTNLSVYTTYYWRVRAKNVRGVGEYSRRQRFTTIITPPTTPPLAGPVTGVIGQPVVISLRWHPVILAEKYVVQLSLDSPFSSTVVEDSTAGDTVMTVGPLNYLTRYYWRVKARNSQGESGYSVVWSFTTVIEAPGMPTQIAPISASSGQPFMVRLIWSRSARAFCYHLQVASDAAFDTLVVSDTSVTDTSRLIGPLDHSRTFYWRVRARNAGWSTPYSPSWSFTTLPPPDQYVLTQNYPNPFNPVTRFTYELPQETEVTLELFNILGQLVRTLVNERQKSGRYEIELDASGLPSGTYLYRLRAGDWSSVKKLLIVR